MSVRDWSSSVCFRCDGGWVTHRLLGWGLLCSSCHGERVRILGLDLAEALRVSLDHVGPLKAPDRGKPRVLHVVR